MFACGEEDARSGRTACRQWLMQVRASSRMRGRPYGLRSSSSATQEGPWTTSGHGILMRGQNKFITAHGTRAGRRRGETKHVPQTGGAKEGPQPGGTGRTMRAGHAALHYVLEHLRAWTLSHLGPSPAKRIGKPSQPVLGCPCKQLSICTDGMALTEGKGRLQMAGPAEHEWWLCP